MMKLASKKSAKADEKEPEDLTEGVKLLPDMSEANRGRMCVVLDMDETLIHSEFVGCSEAEYRKQCGREKGADFFLTVCDGVAVHVRPGLSKFLKLLKQEFEVVVFTAGEKDYADAILDYIDKDINCLEHRLYRGSTCAYSGLNYVKNLHHLNRNMKRIVLVDNNMVSMVATPDNCILVEDFITDPNDEELALVASILIDLSGLDDVRDCLRDAFGLRKIVDERLLLARLQGLNVGED